MAYIGKFTDRSPSIRAAGISVPLDDIKECFKFVSLGEQLKAVGVKEEHEKRTYPMPKSDGKRYAGLYTDVRAMIQPPLKSAFQELKEELEEIAHAKGHSAPTSHYLLPSRDIYEKTYGISTKSDVTAGETINPPKSPGQVMFENSLGHELYVKTHMSYAPGEQVNRNYTSPNFKHDKKFGMPTPWDETGIWVAKVIKWINNEEMCVVTRRQAEYVAQTQPQLGKVLQPNHVLETCVPRGHIFGKTEDRILTLGDVMRQTEPSLEKQEQMDYFGYINKIRFVLKHRDPEFPFQDFYEKLKNCDTQFKNVIPLEELYHACNQYRVPVNQRLLEGLLALTSILSEKKHVYYRKFFELINTNFALPEVPKICDIPLEQQLYETTYASAAADLKRIHTAGQEPEKCETDLGDQCSGSTVRSLISPSIYILHGLNCGDMLKPRCKQEIYEMFQKTGTALDEEKFDVLWTEACKIDKNEKVCVETFKNVLNSKTTKNS
ncbi:EF-hand domain-containing family member B [Schistocerca cancellata]|uniref:EF-hand domain-containing family member B n=1 Tax=Schistocerca cancellata TaxID=274614 RepID=UPI0021182DEE|nr:EF-hand domain-containing family member B [Schistocerca cancellata]